MRQTPISSIDDLEVSMAPRRILLDLASQNGEHKDLHRRACCIPKRACNTIRICDLEPISWQLNTCWYFDSQCSTVAA